MVAARQTNTSGRTVTNPTCRKRAPERPADAPDPLRPAKKRALTGGSRLSAGEKGAPAKAGQSGDHAKAGQSGDHGKAGPSGGHASVPVKADPRGGHASRMAGQRGASASTPSSREKAASKTQQGARPTAPMETGRLRWGVRWFRGRSKGFSPLCVAFWTWVFAVCPLYGAFWTWVFAVCPPCVAFRTWVFAVCPPCLVFWTWVFAVCPPCVCVCVSVSSCTHVSAFHHVVLSSGHKLSHSNIVLTMPNLLNRAS